MSSERLKVGEPPRRRLFQRRPVPAAASALSSDSGLKMEDGFDDEETGRRSPPRLIEFYGDDAASVDEGMVHVDYISHVEECEIEADECCECNEEECMCDMSIPSAPDTSDEEEEYFEEEEEMEDGECLEEEEDFDEEEDSDEIDCMNVSDDSLDEEEIADEVLETESQRLPSVLELAADGGMMWQDAHSSTESVLSNVGFGDVEKESAGSVAMQNRLLRRQRRLRRLEDENIGCRSAGSRIPVVKREDSPINPTELQIALDALGMKNHVSQDASSSSASNASKGSISGQGARQVGDETDRKVVDSRNIKKADILRNLGANIRSKGQKRELGPKVPEPSMSLQNVSFKILNVDFEGIFTVYAMDYKLMKDYDRMTSRMLAFYSTMSHDFMLHEDEIHVGMVVVAEIQGDYYARAVVKNRVERDIFGTGAWEVDCLDEPQTYIVPTEHLHRITESFLTVPRCKMTCELFGLEFFTGQYKLVQNLFVEFMKKQKLNFEGLRANIYIFSNYNALEILQPEDVEAEEDVDFVSSGFCDTVNKAFSRYVYMHLAPKFHLNGVLENAQFLRFNKHGMAVFQYLGRQLDMVTKLGGTYLKTLNSLKPQTLQSLMKDYFEKYTYIHVIKSNEFQVQFQRFKVLDVMYKKNQVFAELVDSGDRVYLNIGDGVFRADHIHESLVKIPPMFFEGNIHDIEAGNNISMIAAYLKPKSIKVKLSGYYESGDQEFEVFVYDDDMNRTLMPVADWMKICKLQDYLKELRL